MTIFVVAILVILIVIFLIQQECFRGSSYSTEIEYSTSSSKRKPEFVEPRNFIF